MTEIVPVVPQCLETAGAELERLVLGPGPDEETRARGLTQIRERLLTESQNIKGGHIERIGSADLRLLFQLLDEICFRGLCRRVIHEAGAHLAFRLARRMTTTGGTCTRHRRPGGDHYIIAISTHVLFENFNGDVDRDVAVNGLVCGDRLDCLIRVLEHEMTHLLEYLLWGDSNCSAPRFFGIVNRHFGHTATKHEMVTRRERAKKVLGLRVGVRVEFDFEGRTLEGIINRITSRATVLVESPEGRPYSNGRRYMKYYVPLPYLRTSAPSVPH